MAPTKIIDIRTTGPKQAYEEDKVNTEDVVLETEDEEEDGSDVDVMEDVISDDFEKTHTLCAAFTVISLVLLFLIEFLIMAIYLVLSNGGFKITQCDSDKNRSYSRILIKIFMYFQATSKVQ